MPIGTGIVYNTGDLILSQVSGSGTAFLETKIAAATSSLIYFDNTARINSSSLINITVGSSSYVSGSSGIITNLTSSNISSSGQIIANGFTGSLFGTSSWATNALTASTIAGTSNAFVQGGNSFGTTAILGTNDAQPLSLETNGTTRMSINSNGNVAINTSTSPFYRLNIEDTHNGSLGSSSLFITTVQNQNQGLATSANDSGINNAYYVNYFTSSTAIQNQAAFNQLYINGSGSFSGSYRASRNGTLLSNTASLDSGGNIINTYLTNQISPNIPTFSIPNWIAGTGTFIDIITGNSTGSINNLYNHQIGSPFSSGGAGGITVNNSYGVYINKQKTTNIVTNGWGIYQVDSNDINYFNGNVGIGTTNPNGRLHVTGSDSSYAFAVAGNTKGVRFNINSLGTYIQGVDNTLAASYQSLILGGSNLYFQTNGVTNAMYINSSGNVGIGTTSPSSLLDVAAAGTARISVTNTSAVRSGSFGIDSNGVYIQNSNNGDYFDLKNASGVARFRLVYDNNTFINTTHTSVGSLTASGSKLSVFGNLSVGSSYGSIAAPSNGAIFQGGVGIGTNSPNYLLDLYDTGASNAMVALRNSGSGNARIYLDAANGDLIGSDYCYLGQDNDTLDFVINTANVAGNIHLQPKSGTTNGILYVSGSTRFGNVSTNTHQFTGSVSMSDGLFITNLTASNVSASNSIITSDITASNAIIRGNLTVTGSIFASLFSASNVYITSSTLTVTDNILTLNALTPYQRYAGIEMYDSGSGNVSSFLWDGQGDYFFISGSGVNGKIITGPDGQTDLTSNYIPKATAGYKLGNSVIYDDGTNVGIGTTVPGSKLQINDNTPTLTLRANNGGVSRKAYIDFYTTFFNYPSDVGARRTSTIVTGFADGTYGTWGTEFLSFNVGSGSANDAALLPIERMRIDGSGNVGIGVTSPSGRLHITASATNGQSLVYLSKGSGSITQYYINAVNQLGQLNYRVSSDINGHASQTLYQAGTAYVYHDSYWSSWINNSNYTQGGLNLGSNGLTHGYGLTIAKPATSGSLYVSGSSVFTGSVNVSGSVTFSGPIIYDNAVLLDYGSTTTPVVSTNYAVLQNLTGSYNAAFFDYFASSGSNFRAGTVIAGWSGSSVNYTEYATTDTGNTNQLSMSVDLSGSFIRLLTRVSTTTNWNIKSSGRYL